MLRFDNSSKRPTNPRQNAKMLAMSRELGMMHPLGELHYWERWNQENKDAVAAYNERIERDGLPLAKYRTFMKGR